MSDAREMSVLGDVMLEMIPPYYSEDPPALAVIDSVAREVERVEEAMADIRARILPHRSDEKYNTLAIWEQMMGLPINPAGVSLEARRQMVLARLRSRRDGSGKTWEKTITTALRTTAWTYQENSPGGYQLSVWFPYAAGGYTAGQALALLRKVTPAHIELVVSYTQGFIVGISHIGQEKLGGAIPPNVIRFFGGNGKAVATLAITS